MAPVDIPSRHEAGAATSQPQAQGGSKEYPLVALALLFTYIGSRCLFWALGLRFDSGGTEALWQLLDPHWLQQDLWRSLYYMHGQPPLFNLFVGLVYQFAGGAAHAVFYGTFLAFGLLVYGTLYSLLRRFAIPVWPAYILATVYILSPEALLLEHWLFYTWPIIGLLLVMAWSLLSYEQSGRIGYAALCLAAIVVICYTRSAFHLVYLLVAVVLMLFIKTTDKKAFRISCVIAVVLVSALYLKNYSLYGFFGSSSWMGMNMWRIASFSNRQEADAVAASYQLNSVNAFSAVNSFPEDMAEVPSAWQSVDLLVSERKPSGAINFNHYAYLDISARYQHASMELIMQDVPAYLNGVITAWQIYAVPPWLGRYGQQSESIRTYIDAFAFYDMRLKGEQRLLDRRLFAPYSSGVPVLLATLFVVLYVPWLVLSKRASSPLTLLFMLATILYVSVLGNSIEIYENNRFRAMTDPFLLVLLGLCTRDLFRRLRGRSSATGSLQ